MEYGGFEGTIPKGQYGGGTVMIWDFGEWRAIGDADRQFEKGDLKFELHGTKLKGKWVLVRMRKNLDRSDKPNWLLIKESDEYAQSEDAPAITDEAPNSAVTQRTMEQIAESKDHVWDSNQGLLIGATIVSNNHLLATPVRALNSAGGSSDLCATRPMKYFQDLFPRSWPRRPPRRPIATTGSMS